MFSKRWIKSPLRRRYLIAIGISVLVLIAAAAFNAAITSPQKGRVADLETRAKGLQSEKSKLLAEVSRKEGEGHGHGHGHAHGIPSGPDPLEDDALVLSLRILAGEKPLGLKAMQLEILEEVARIASATGVEGFSYQRLMEEPEKVGMVNRRPEPELSFTEDIYRYRFRIEFSTDYAGAVDFLDRVEAMPRPVVAQGIRLGGGGDGRLRVQLDLAAYFRHKG